MKFLLLLLVLTLSTLYVSSMNSPTPPPTLQALRDYKVEYLKIQESFVVWGTTFFDQMQEYNQNLLMEAIERENEERVNKEEMVEEEWEEEVEEVSDQVDEIVELGEREKEENFLEEIQSVEEEEGIQKEEMIVEELEEKSVEVSDQMDEFIELNERETEEILQVSEKEVILDEEVLEAESTSLNEEEEMVQDELEKTGDVTDESHDSMELLGIEETSVISETLENLPLTQHSIGADTPSISEPEVISSQKEMEEDSEPMELELTEKRAIGITVISVILAYIVLKFLSIIRSRKPSAKDNSVTFKKPSFEYAAKEKNGGSIQMLLKKEGSTQVLLKKEEINAERIEKAAESYVKPCSSILSGAKDHEEISRIQAPTVELLGEYVVEELNSSFKSCSLKPKTVECEESIFSESLDQKPRRMAFSSPVNQEHPSFSEFSAINSPSYGSFTALEKIGRKKEARDGEEATTPLRRSSRLRSKSVTSP